MAGWTQTPNFIMDAIPDMKPAEVQVVMAIVRQTIGWKRDSISLTMHELEILTKMARASVVDGTREALKRGVISRVPDGKSFIYSIAEPCPKESSVQILNRHEGESVQILNSQPSPSVQNLDSKERKPVQIPDPQSVQILNPIEININTNKTKLDDEDDKARERGKVFTTWAENFPGTMTPILSEKINDLVDECGAPSVIHGIVAGVEAGARNFSYVAKCARNHAAGREPPPKANQRVPAARNGHNGYHQPAIDEAEVEATKQWYESVYGKGTLNGNSG